MASDTVRTDKGDKPCGNHKGREGTIKKGRGAVRKGKVRHVQKEDDGPLEGEEPKDKKG